MKLKCYKLSIKIYFKTHQAIQLKATEADKFNGNRTDMVQSTPLFVNKSIGANLGYNGHKIIFIPC